MSYREAGEGALVPPEIDLQALKAYRLQRLRDQLKAADVDLFILTSPIALRYAIDFREYQLFQSHIPATILFVPAEGPLVLHGASERKYDQVTDYRASPNLTAFDGGFELAERSRVFAASVKDALASLGIKKGFPRVAIERAAPSLAEALCQSGLELVDADNLLERAKSIKSAEEIQCISYSLQVAQKGMTSMRAALQPGISENELWAILHATNISHDGDWFDGRMLASGPRTNPWLREATGRVIEAGDLVAFDTDMIGPFGYCADVSRTWLCGPGRPSAAQRDLYRHAYDEVHHNIALIKAGVTSRELSERAFPVREEFVAHRYPCLAHGVGMSDEWPKIYYRQDWARTGYDAVLEEGMVICVESFTGSEQGGEGVKLEQCVRVTDSGTEVLSRYPFEAELL